MHITRGQQPGQTLLEAMVAIGVILTAVIGSSTLIISSITVGRISQNRVEAANFAREGVEIVRSIRDSNWLKIEQNQRVGGSLPSWDAGLGGDGIVAYDITSAIPQWKIISCVGCGTNETKIYKQVSGSTTYYTQSASPCAGCTATRYSRLISMTFPGNDPQGLSYLLVESTVTWSDRTGSKNLTARTRLYDWK